jgi:hypothetical protein
VRLSLFKVVRLNRPDLEGASDGFYVLLSGSSSTFEFQLKPCIRY